MYTQIIDDTKAHIFQVKYCLSSYLNVIRLPSHSSCAYTLSFEQDNQDSFLTFIGDSCHRWPSFLIYLNHFFCKQIQYLTS